MNKWYIGPAVTGRTSYRPAKYSASLSSAELEELKYKIRSFLF